MRSASLAAAVLLALALAGAAPAASGAAGSPSFAPAGMGTLWQNATGHHATLWSVRWSPDGTMVSATYFDNSTVVYNSTTGKTIMKIAAPPVPAGRCDGYTPPGDYPMRVSAWSPDGKYLAMGGDDRVVLLYSVGTWDLAGVLRGHRGSVLTLDFSPDGRYLASGSGTDKVEMNNANDENVVKVWDVANLSLVTDLRGHTDGVMEVRWSPDGGRLVSVSDDKTIRVWNTSNWSLEGVLRGHTLGVLCVDFSPDGGELVTGSRDYTIRLWNLTDDPANFTQWQRWPAPNCVRSVDWHPDGEWIAAAGVDEAMLTIRNATTGVVVRTFTDSAPTRSAVMSARWSPDGRCLAAGSGKDMALRVYTTGKGRPAPGGGIPWWVPKLAIYSIISWAGVVLITIAAMRHMERERR